MKSNTGYGAIIGWSPLIIWLVGVCCYVFLIVAGWEGLIIPMALFFIVVFLISIFLGVKLTSKKSNAVREAEKLLEWDSDVKEEQRIRNLEILDQITVFYDLRARIIARLIILFVRVLEYFLTHCGRYEHIILTSKGVVRGKYLTRAWSDFGFYYSDPELKCFFLYYNPQRYSGELIFTAENNFDEVDRILSEYLNRK